MPRRAGDYGGQQASSMLVYLLTLLAITTILTWLYNRSQGSLLLVGLAHASVNASQAALVTPLFPSLAGTEVNALLGLGVPAQVLLAVTRGRLGLAAPRR